MVKAIFFDIDGTLLSFKTSKMIESTKNALVALKEKGVKLFIASGRPRSNMKTIDDFWTFDGYVSFNGQYCLVGDEVVWSNPIKKEDLKSMCDYIKKEDIICDIMELERSYVNKMDSRLDFLLAFSGITVGKLPIEPIENILNNEIYQMGPFITREKEVEFLKHTPTCKSARWHDEFTDIIPLEGGKDVGIDKVLEKLGIDISETMAFGDGGNDLSMLKHVHIGVAMGNAKDYVKDVADYVTDSVDEDGIYNALKHFNIL